MKKLLFSIIAIICSLVFVNAQESTNQPKHIFGVRAGINFAKSPYNGWVGNETINKGGTGFHVGGIYEIALSKKRKWYFHTGLNLKYLTAKAETPSSYMYSDYGTYTYYNEKYRALYLEIPLMFTRQIRFTDDWGLRPAIGFSYGQGLFAKSDREKTRYERNELIYSETGEINLFKDDTSKWETSVGKVELALNLTYKNYLLGVEGSLGGDLWDLGITFGYNF